MLKKQNKLPKVLNMNKFIKKLEALQQKNNSLLCVGLDTDFEKIPRHLRACKDPVFKFNQAIIQATHDLVCAYKPNIAFYEAQGEGGLRSLKKTVNYLKKNYSQIPIILDAKRADIGNTNQAYIQAFFKDLKVDALTLHPYLGQQALQPFLDLKNKFFFILCRTSNPGAAEFQNLKVKNLPLYLYLAGQVAKKWNHNNNCGLVVGATYPLELKRIRKIVGNMLLLVPGVGKQGGAVEKTVKAGKNSSGLGMVINSSRGIIYSRSGKDFAQAASKAADNLRKEINKYR